jgi:hypothetical protein
MAPCKFQRNLETNHPTLNTLPASYSLLIFSAKKAHIESERVIMPAILIAVEVMLGAQFQKQMLMILIFNNTIS